MTPPLNICSKYHLRDVRTGDLDGGNTVVSAPPPISNVRQFPSGPTLQAPPRRSVSVPLDEDKYLMNVEDGKDSTAAFINSDSNFDRESSSDINYDPGDIDNSSKFIQDLETQIKGHLGCEYFNEGKDMTARTTESRIPTKPLESEPKIPKNGVLSKIENSSDCTEVQAAENRFRRELFSTGQHLNEQTFNDNTIGSENAQAVNTLLSERLRKEGHIAVSKGNHLLAGLFYLRNIQLNVHNGKSWQSLARSEGRRKQSLKANRTVLCQALQHNPKNAFLWQSLGFLLFRMRHYESARTHFEKGISVDPTHAPLYSTWAHMEFGMREIEKARVLYKRGSELENGGSRVLQNWGQMEERLGNSVRAMELYKKGLELEPKNPYLLETKGSMAWRNKEYDMARCYFQKALESDDHKTCVCESYAEMEAMLGNFDDARRLFEEAVASDVRNSSTPKLD